MKMNGILNRAPVTVHPPSVLKSEKVLELIIEYQKTKSSIPRNSLIEHYRAYVQSIATIIHKKHHLPSLVDVEDLISYGIFGLIDALDAFEIKRGLKFETYSFSRIRGAILDGIRDEDWVPRLVRLRSRDFQRASGALEKAFGVSPTNDQIREYLGLSEVEFDLILPDTVTLSTDSLSRKIKKPDNSSGFFVSDMVADHTVIDPARSVMIDDLRNAILKPLDRTSRLVVALYHFEGYSLKEVGELLQVSESRVSQMHSSAIKIIRSNSFLQKLACEAFNISAED